MRLVYIVLWHIECFNQEYILSKIKINIYYILPNAMRRPGVEPGTSAWKAPMLTVTPSTPHEICETSTLDDLLRVLSFFLNLIL